MKNVEFSITYKRGYEAETLPSPKFKGVEWEGYPEADSQIGQVVEINGEKWNIEVLGFQSSGDRGEVQMHQEPSQQEDVYFLAGNGEMIVWNGMNCIRRPDESNYWSHKLVGIISNEEAEGSKFVLALATDLHNMTQKLVLNVTDIEGKLFTVDPISTRKGYYHSTTLNEQSLYFVVKRSKI